ncbi:MAG: hypothetical protein LUG51_16340 [Tannerellaceae bacterium]|nr:hypothetical protein [Tannerellaceae bacterium]
MIEDEDTYTPILIKLIRLWQIIVLPYILVFLVVAVHLYEQLVIHPLEQIKPFNVPQNSFIWRTFEEGIVVGYMCSCIPLAFFYFLEFACCEVYLKDKYYQIQCIQASRKIRLALIITVLLMACSVPLVIRIRA